MNILYIGDFNENTDVGRGSVERATSLREAGAKVATRHIGNSKVKFKEEEDVINEFDCVIQSTQPYNLTYNSNFLNVSHFDYELDNFVGSNFHKHLNLMDLCLVSSEHSLQCYQKSGVTTPTIKMPFPSKSNRYSEDVNCPSYMHNLLSKQNFVFYTIASGDNISYLEQLVLAYYTEFSQREKVSLIIKVDQNNKQLKNIVESQIKKINRVFDPDMLLIMQDYPQFDCMGLHCYANCYIDVSYGKNWSYDAFDAMACGRSVIVPKSTCFTEFIDDSNGYILDIDTEPCYNNEDIWGGTYRCNQHWGRPLISSIKNTMRKVFQDRQTENSASKAEIGISNALRFDTMKLGGSLLEALNYAQKKKLERLH